MEKLKRFLSRLGNAILNDLMGIPLKIATLAFAIFIVLLKFVSGFFMWGGLILGFLALTGHVTWEENWAYILVGLIALVARYLSNKIIKAI